MSQIHKKRVYGNFKPPRSQRIRDRNNKSAVKRAKRPGNDLDYKKKIKKLPCIVTGVQHNIDPHHLKCMGGRGAGMKAPDKCLVPLCRDEHNKVESIPSRGEEAWFLEQGIDCKKLAEELWLMRTNFKDMEAVWQKHWDRKSKLISVDRKTGQPVGR